MLKRLVSGLCIVLVLCFSFCANVYAFPGFFHYIVAEKILEEGPYKDLTKEESDAFKAASVWADVGACIFDKKAKIDSDSHEFLEIMKKHATKKTDKWFLKGLMIHIFLDKQTTKILQKIFNKKDFKRYEYLKYYGILDWYLMNKYKRYIYTEHLSKFKIKDLKSRFSNAKQIVSSAVPRTKLLSIGLNVLRIRKGDYRKLFGNNIAKNNISNYDDLLIKTYKSIGLDITPSELHIQMGNVVAAFILLQVLYGKEKDLVLDAKKIDDEIKNLVTESINLLKDH